MAGPFHPVRNAHWLLRLNQAWSVAYNTSLMRTLRTKRFGFVTGCGGTELGVYKQVPRSEASYSFPEPRRHPLGMSWGNGDLLQEALFLAQC